MTDFHKEVLSRTGCSTRNLRGRGLTAVIRDAFYPDYVFKKNGEGGVFTSRRNKKEKKGMARGRLVDDQVRRWIQGKVEKKNRKKFHPFARAFIELTEKVLRLSPAGAQVVVRDEESDLATLADAVFVDRKGKTVVLELKTGFENYNEKFTGNMRGGFSFLTNCPGNQHKVQLALTAEMFEKTFPELGAVKSLLVRMTSAGAHVVKLASHSKIRSTARALLDSKTLNRS